MVGKVRLELTMSTKTTASKTVGYTNSPTSPNKIGGLGRNRTDTPIKETDFESVVATSYTTSPFNNLEPQIGIEPTTY
jgi:phage-related protein